MRQHAATLFLALALGTPLTALTAPLVPLAPTPVHVQAARVSAEVLSKFHFKPQALDAAMSGAIFDHYIKQLDPERMFFLQSDIDDMADDRLQLGAGILQRDLTIPFAIYNLYLQRAGERLAAVQTMLDQDFAFGGHDSYRPERGDQPWPVGEEQADSLWREKLKDQCLRARLAGEADQAIRARLHRRYDSALAGLRRTSSDDVFDTFMNAYTMAIDPHSNYMGPHAAEEMNIAMSLSLVGIGASMEEKDGFHTISALAAGGPARLSGKLKVGDRIVGVAQGLDAPMVSVQGGRVDQTVALVRGALDSTVVLDVLPASEPADGRHQRIVLVRKKIALDDGAAKARTVTVASDQGQKRIGIISLPSFYRDVEAEMRGERQFRSASVDVARLLSQLKRDKADAILIDLRDNGGGSLPEAVAVTGLFTGKGPVLQQRDTNNTVVMQAHTDDGVAWHGPVGVLINHNSASASEILAAAIQDYGRGVVIGERSFGKGTVQQTIRLDELVEPGPARLGELKMTIAQFFRIDGRTTQLRGVEPDVGLVMSGDDGHWGEAQFDNPLPWATVKPANYQLQGKLKPLIPALASLSRQRTAANPQFQSLQALLANDAASARKNSVSLNEDERRRERNARLALAKSLKLDTTVEEEVDEGLAAFAPSESKPDENGQKAAQDLILDEAARVVGDEAAMLARARSAKVEPGFAAHRSHSTAGSCVQPHGAQA